MAQSSSLANKVMEMCKQQYPAMEIVHTFFQLNDWPQEHDLQLAIQHIVVRACDVDAATEVLMRSEFKCNVTFDFDEIMNMIVQNATADQALKVLRKVHLSPAPYLQRIVLSKGTHAQIIELKGWQLSPSKLEPKRFL
ncbi:hypothetical protein [Psychrobacter sp. AOP31-A1-22]|uniref:hypothetical protein n=1 Tax=Psychrobacter sp. AOP31-A1-22 TaxID=3457696 RepID=UPI0040369F19